MKIGRFILRGDRNMFWPNQKLKETGFCPKECGEQNPKYNKLKCKWKIIHKHMRFVCCFDETVHHNFFKLGTARDIAIYADKR